MRRAIVLEKTLLRLRENRMEGGIAVFTQIQKVKQVEEKLAKLEFKFQKAKQLSKLKAFLRIQSSAAASQKDNKKILAYYKAQKAYFSKKSLMLKQLELIEKVIQKELTKKF